MSLRLALLPQTPRRLLALALVVLCTVPPAVLIWISAAGVAERWAVHSTLTREVETLSAALTERARAEGPAGAGLSADARAADVALERRADTLAAAFDGAGVAVTSREAPEAAAFAGVSERRLTLAAAGAPDALAEALADAAQDPQLAISFAELDSPRAGTARVRLVLVEVIAPEAGS